MDRYQFEDAISAYLENELSLTERQAFETYMNENPEAKELVAAIRLTMKSMKNLTVIKTSDNFILDLSKRIEFEKNRPSKKIVKRPSKSLFGFTPLYAGLMTVLVASFITVGVNLWSVNEKSVDIAPAFTGNISETPKPASTLSTVSLDSKTILTDANVDSADSTIDKKKKYKLDDKVKFVKDRH